MVAADRPPERLVIRAPNWLGDAVMALPAMEAVRSAFPDTAITVAAQPAIAPLFAEMTSAAPNHILTISDQAAEVEALRAQRFDAALLLPNSFRSAWLLRRAGIPERWGYGGRLRGWTLTRAVHRPRHRVHQSAWYLELVKGLGLPAPDRLPRVQIRFETAARASTFLEDAGVDLSRPLVGFAPGAAYGHAKRWPPARVADVITRLTLERGAVCLIVGTGSDRGAGREIESLLPSAVRVINAIGRTDLRLVSGLLARCGAFVSNDSGAMHLAAAVGVPVTAVFGPTDERVTAPLGEHDVLIHQVFCRPCMLRDCPIDHRCMKGVTADAVLTSVTHSLEARA